jgi:hypothetical protein
LVSISIVVRSTETRFEVVNFVRVIRTTIGVFNGKDTRCDGDSHIIAVSRSQISEFTKSTSGKHGYTVSSESSSATRKVLVDGGLLQVTRVTSELKVNGGQVRSVVEGARHTVRRDDIVRERFKSSHNIVARVSGVEGDSISLPVFSEDIVENNGELTPRVGSGTIDKDGEFSISSVGFIIDVKRVYTMLALSKRAVSTEVASIAVASHGGILVPKLISVGVVHFGNLSNGLANTVAGAVIRAGSSLASRAFIAIKAFTQAILSIADAFVRALHVVVGTVGHAVAGGVHHVGELFGCTIRVHHRAGNNGLASTGKSVATHV